MSYTGRSPRYDIPWWDTGEVSSGVWNERISTEIDYLIELLDSLATGGLYDGTVVDGFACSAGAGLSLNVAAGLGMVDGIRIYASGVTAKTLSDNSTLYIYLKLTATSFYDRSFTVEESVSGPPMADAILIAKVITASGSISSVDNNPTGRAPRLRVPGLPRIRVVAPAGAPYTDPKTAIEGASAGDVVYICAGTYNIGSTITLAANNITIIGAGRESTVLYWNVADANHCINLGSYTGITVRDLTVQAIASKTGAGILGGICSYSLIENLAIVGPNLAQGVYMTGAAIRPRILHCRVSGGMGYGIEMYGPTDALLLHNFIEISAGGASYAIVVFPNSHRAMVAHNNILMSGAAVTRAVYAYDVDRFLLFGNLIRVTNPGSGMWFRVRASGRTTVQPVISNNQIISSGLAGTGIYLDTGDPYNLDDSQLSGNKIHQCAQAINIVDSRVRYTLVHGNSIRDNTAGISDSGTSSTLADNA